MLGLALVTHMGLALYKLAERKTLNLPPWELVQLGFGLLIPFLLFPHIVNTRIAHTYFGVEDNYLYELARLWPVSAIIQSTLLVLVWVHGCIGIHFWLRLYTPYRALQPVLLFLAVAIPLAALAGFMVSGRAVAQLIEDPAMLARVKELTALAERCQQHAARGVARLCAARLRGRAGPDRGLYRRALRAAHDGAEDHGALCRRSDGEGGAGRDAARDQPHEPHRACLGVRWPRALLDLPRAHRRHAPRRWPRRYSRRR